MEVVFLGIFNLSGMSNYICLLITVPVELRLFVLLFFKPRSSSQAGRCKVCIILRHIQTAHTNTALDVVKFEVVKFKG